MGWGHKFTGMDGDFWRAPVVPKGLRWDWHCSNGDQGLLYYYPKFVRRSVSFIIWNDIEHWGTGTNNTLQLESTSFGLLSQFSCRPPFNRMYKPPSPYRDFVHFTGESKRVCSGDKNDSYCSLFLLTPQVEASHGIRRMEIWKPGFTRR